MTGTFVPASDSAAAVMLVSTVTAITSGAGRPSALAVFRAASTAACIIFIPPEA